MVQNNYNGNIEAIAMLRSMTVRMIIHLRKFDDCRFTECTVEHGKPIWCVRLVFSAKQEKLFCNCSTNKNYILDQKLVF